MKKLYLLPFLFLAITTFAQKQIVVQGSTTQTFSDLNSAIAAATAGDTIYIPGGGFTVSGTIDKTLHWRGVGHYPDSTAATGFTNITSGVGFSGNCDNSTFEGIYFASSVSFGTDGNETTGIIINRCRIIGLLTLRANSDIAAGHPDLNFRLNESVVANIDARLGTNVRLTKNMVFSNLTGFYQCFFDHNDFNYSGTTLVYSSEFCQFTNNVFSYSYALHSTTLNCNFQNNLFQAGMPFDPVITTHTSSENITGVGVANIYTSISSNNYSFDYANDYHLKAGSPGIGAATDGTNIGIYGTSLPYKDGAVPYAPHIRAANIDNVAVSGNLGVQITVAAQER